MFWSIQKSKYEWYGPTDQTEPRAFLCRQGFAGRGYTPGSGLVTPALH